MIYFRKNEITHANEQVAFHFNGGVTGYSVSDFLMGRAFTYTENSNDPGNEVTGSDTEFYVQDDWKASTGLTLNMGLRGYLSRGGNGGAAVSGNIANFVPSLFDPSKVPQITPAGGLVSGTGDLLNGIITPANLKPNKTAWGPRFGLAWAPGSRKSVIRGGYGIK